MPLYPGNASYMSINREKTEISFRKASKENKEIAIKRPTLELRQKTRIKNVNT